MGQQAGGASVHYHLLSPITRGLFHRYHSMSTTGAPLPRAVSMSGSALCWWASLKRPQERAVKMAKLVECPQVLRLLALSPPHTSLLRMTWPSWWTASGTSQCLS